MPFSITHSRIATETLRSTLENDASGAMVCFEGWVRNHSEGKPVLRLEYEVYEALALREGQQILQEARERFPIREAVCVHRAGALEIGDCAVWVGVSTSHRGDAFEACRFIIDAVKARVPIWKKEYFSDGTAEWVNCAACAATGEAHAHSHKNP
jgi:molybdopterin synthase catalytic subunit